MSTWKQKRPSCSVSYELETLDRVSPRVSAMSSARSPETVLVEAPLLHDHGQMRALMLEETEILKRIAV